jgi:hypothetical protein
MAIVAIVAPLIALAVLGYILFRASIDYNRD